MPDGAASILLASASSIARLCAEGGLRSSFFAVFKSTSVLDTADAGDGDSLDDLLRSHRLIACDHRLISPIEDATTDAERLKLYRTNFVAKLARRRVILLAVLDTLDAVELLDQCRRDATLLAAANAHCRCEVVVVVTDHMTPHIRAALKLLRMERSIARIYLMTKWLQSGRATRHVALARHVWPVCVTRLLVARALSAPTTRAKSDASVMAWRTFAWGTLTASTSLSSWEAAYLHALRDRLMPPRDVTQDDRVHDASGVTSGDKAAAASRPLPSMCWTATPKQISDAGNEALDPSCLNTIISTTCTNAAAAGLVARNTRETLLSRIRTAWTRVASGDGLCHLRRLRDGRQHRPHALASLSQVQRERWRRLNEDRNSLDRCRTNHGRALGALTLARRRHLPLSWRFLIAAMILPCVFQFLAGVLLPLRSEDADSGSPLFSFPRRPAGSIAYLVDHSSSMEGERLERVKSDLKAAIADLREGTQFTVAVFNDKDQPDELPAASGRLIEATKTSRSAAMDWVDAIKAEGGTRAEPSIRKLLERHPDSLVFLTDGQFQDPDRTQLAILLDEQALLGKTRIDTVMLYPVGEESMLVDLAAKTGGRFRRVGFDPLAPLGFNRVLLIVFCATAAGVMLGAWLPWLMERLAGFSGTQTLSEHLTRLLKSYDRFGQDTAVALSHADDFDGSRRSNYAWSYQRSLAARALGQIEASLTDPTLLHEQPRSAQRNAIPMEVLAKEDWRDVHEALDEPLPDLHDIAQHQERIHDIVAVHAKELAELWHTFASDQDPLSHGHLPLDAIAERFGDAVGQRLMQASRLLLLPQRHTGASHVEGRRPFYEMFDSLAERISDDAHRPFLSARVDAPSGEMPARSLTWIGATWHDSFGDVDELAKSYFKQHTQIRFVDDLATSDVGVRALGLIHEEMEVALAASGDDTPDYTPLVGDDA